jgi:hypothetical protein
MADSNISAKIAGAAAFASIRGSGTCVNIVEAGHFASIMSKDTFALIAAARALAITAESRQNAEIAMAEKSVLMADRSTRAAAATSAVIKSKSALTTNAARDVRNAEVAVFACMASAETYAPSA